MRILVLLIAGVVLFMLIWWWFVGRHKPVFPPLKIEEDDPDMLTATVAAKNTIDKFELLYAKGGMEYQVKVPVKTSSNVIEHLWADVLSFENETVQVRYLTPPVSHEGSMERLASHSINELTDWVAITQEGNIHGGYTQRVMFKKAREQWGHLPPKLAEQEKKFI